jgi:hypothetical protein
MKKIRSDIMTQEGTALEWTQRRTIEEVRDLINKGEQKENGKYSK